MYFVSQPFQAETVLSEGSVPPAGAGLEGVVQLLNESDQPRRGQKRRKIKTEGGSAGPAGGLAERESALAASEADEWEDANLDTAMSIMSQIMGLMESLTSLVKPVSLDMRFIGLPDSVRLPSGKRADGKEETRHLK